MFDSCRFGGGDVADVGGCCLGSGTVVVTGHFRDWRGGVGEFVFVDVAVWVFGVHGGGVVGEPFLAGGGGVGGGLAAWRLASSAVALSALTRVIAVCARCSAHTSSISVSCSIWVSRRSASAGLGSLLLQALAGVGVSGGVGFRRAKGDGLSVSGGGLGGAGEFVDHPWWSPGLFAFPGPDADPELPVAHAHFVAVGIGPA